MLCLSRRIDEVVLVKKGGKVLCKIQVLEFKGNAVKLGLEAPPEIDIERPDCKQSKTHRKEV